jgi:capping protein beta
MLTLLAVSPTSSSSGSWDSIHVFDAQDRARTAHYKLTSTVILSLGTENDALGGLDLSGNMVRQVEADMAVEDDTSHVANIGKMVEDMELKMRNLLQEVYFGKAKDVVGDLRSTLTRVCCLLSKMSLTMSQASHRSARRTETGQHRGR